MKKITILTLLTISMLISFGQSNNNFDQLLQQYPPDSELVQKLKNFQSTGIEKSLDLDTTTMSQIIDTALSYKGTPHCMGGITHSCIDCSGLLYISFKNNDVNIPHNSQEIARYGKIIVAPDSLQRGDLVFFVETYRTSKVITHSGIYLGEGNFIHTSASRGVMISNLSSKYYSDHYIFGTRIIK